MRKKIMYTVKRMKHSYSCKGRIKCLMMMIVIIITCTEEGQSKIICARHNHWNYSDSFFFSISIFFRAELS